MKKTYGQLKQDSNFEAIEKNAADLYKVAKNPKAKKTLDFYCDLFGWEKLSDNVTQKTMADFYSVSYNTYTNLLRNSKFGYSTSKLSDWDDKDIARAYSDGVSVRKLAEEYNVSTSTIYRHLKNKDLEGKLSDWDDKDIARAYSDGVSVRKLAEEYNVSGSTIYRHLKNKDLEGKVDNCSTEEFENSSSTLLGNVILIDDLREARKSRGWGGVKKAVAVRAVGLAAATLLAFIYFGSSFRTNVSDVASSLVGKAYAQETGVNHTQRKEITQEEAMGYSKRAMPIPPYPGMDMKFTGINNGQIRVEEGDSNLYFHKEDGEVTKRFNITREGDRFYMTDLTDSLLDGVTRGRSMERLAAAQPEQRKQGDVALDVTVEPQLKSTVPTPTVTEPQKQPKNVSIVDFLNKRGVKSDKESRAPLYFALNPGETSYCGTASENLSLIQRLEKFEEDENARFNTGIYKSLIENYFDRDYTLKKEGKTFIAKKKTQPTQPTIVVAKEVPSDLAKVRGEMKEGMDYIRKVGEEDTTTEEKEAQIKAQIAGVVAGEDISKKETKEKPTVLGDIKTYWNEQTDKYPQGLNRQPKTQGPIGSLEGAGHNFGNAIDNLFGDGADGLVYTKNGVLIEDTVAKDYNKSLREAIFGWEGKDKNGNDRTRENGFFYHITHPKGKNFLRAIKDITLDPLYAIISGFVGESAAGVINVAEAIPSAIPNNGVRKVTHTVGGHLQGATTFATNAFTDNQARAYGAGQIKKEANITEKDIDRGLKELRKLNKNVENDKRNVFVGRHRAALSDIVEKYPWVLDTENGKKLAEGLLDTLHERSHSKYASELGDIKDTLDEHEGIKTEEEIMQSYTKTELNFGGLPIVNNFVRGHNREFNPGVDSANLEDVVIDEEAAKRAEDHSHQHTPLAAIIDLGTSVGADVGIANVGDGGLFDEANLDGPGAEALID